ncbi:pancreatic secretory granule membrane major glycoprotein GP2-like [Alligator mississippiensis]|uniref:Pancreatic secretory granule membrane major glycoprotein GP2-like n=2 Tax=Alligator mississippiensis TaxID=8496 RepID=A0A151NML9_ALLMI|nr:pancreatic secretory granule membrane major glycoprotein GP2-like [Alligator mississippiensis]
METWWNPIVGHRIPFSLYLGGAHFSEEVAKPNPIASSYVDFEEEINETITCAKDQIEVEIPSDFFLSKNPPILISDLYLNDPACHGTETANLYVFSIKNNFTDCGTQMASDDTHIVFTNTIQSNFSEVITRTFINITFACRYPINYLVQQPNGDNKISVDIRTITLNTEDGNFSVSMMLYKDPDFEDMWTTIPFLTLEDNIFVKVNMVPGHLIIRLENCWSTPARNPSHAVQYSFIEQSCPQVIKDETLSVITNGESADAMFRIQMFKFVGISYNDVFLHCTVQICYNTPAVCKPNCTNYGKIIRNKRDASSFPTRTVSYGPIKRKMDGNEEANRIPTDGRNLPPVESLVLGGVLMAVLVITGVFGKLLLQSRRAYPPMQAQLTMSHFHNSEVPS